MNNKQKLETIARIDIARQLAEKHDMTIPEANSLILSVFESIKGHMIDRKRVELRGFGIFYSNEVTKPVRNPKTNQILLEACNFVAPRFRPAKDLKRKLRAIDTN